MTPPEDAGTPDSGNPGDDSGTPDAGTPDSGNPGEDSGQPDSGNPGDDSGNPGQDSGQPDSDTPDTGVDGGSDAGTPPTQDAGTDAGSCVYSPGWYKNHSNWSILPVLMGTTFYTQAECLALMNTPPRGDSSLILAFQLIAAIENGGSNNPNAGAIVAAAREWMLDNGTTLPYGIPTSTPAGAEAVNLAALLDAFNNGKGGVPHCN